MKISVNELRQYAHDNNWKLLKEDSREIIYLLPDGGFISCELDKDKVITSVSDPGYTDIEITDKQQNKSTIDIETLILWIIAGLILVSVIYLIGYNVGWHHGYNVITDNYYNYNPYK